MEIKITQDMIHKIMAEDISEDEMNALMNAMRIMIKHGIIK